MALEAICPHNYVMKLQSSDKCKAPCEFLFMVIDCCYNGIGVQTSPQLCIEVTIKWQMQGTMGIAFHGCNKKRSLLVKQGWIQQTSNQGTTYRFALR